MIVPQHTVEGSWGKTLELAMCRLLVHTMHSQLRIDCALLDACLWCQTRLRERETWLVLMRRQLAHVCHGLWAHFLSCLHSSRKSVFTIPWLDSHDGEWKRCTHGDYHVLPSLVGVRSGIGSVKWSEGCCLAQDHHLHSLVSPSSACCGDCLTLASPACYNWI